MGCAGSIDDTGDIDRDGDLSSTDLSSHPVSLSNSPMNIPQPRHEPNSVLSSNRHQEHEMRRLHSGGSERSYSLDRDRVPGLFLPVAIGGETSSSLSPGLTLSSETQVSFVSFDGQSSSARLDTPKSQSNSCSAEMVPQAQSTIAAFRQRRQMLHSSNNNSLASGTDPLEASGSVSTSTHAARQRAHDMFSDSVNSTSNRSWASSRETATQPSTPVAIEPEGSFVIVRQPQSPKKRKNRRSEQRKALKPLVPWGDPAETEHEETHHRNVAATLFVMSEIEVEPRPSRLNPDEPPAYGNGMTRVLRQQPVDFSSLPMMPCPGSSGWISSPAYSFSSGSSRHSSDSDTRIPAPPSAEPAASSSPRRSNQYSNA